MSILPSLLCVQHSVIHPYADQLKLHVRPNERRISPTLEKSCFFMNLRKTVLWQLCLGHSFGCWCDDRHCFPRNMPPWQSMAAFPPCLPPLHYIIASPATAFKLLSELGAPCVLPWFACAAGRSDRRFPPLPKTCGTCFLGWPVVNRSLGGPMVDPSSPRPVASEYPWLCSNTVPILEAVLTRVTGRSSATLSEMNIAVSCLCAVARTLDSRACTSRTRRRHTAHDCRRPLEVLPASSQAQKQHTSDLPSHSQRYSISH